MTPNLTARVLVWAALLAVLMPFTLAFRYDKSEDGPVHPSDKQDIYSAEAAVMIENDKSEEGEVCQASLTAISAPANWKTGPRRHQSTGWRQIHFIQSERER